MTPTITKSTRLHHHLMELVQSELRPHDRLPTERELAEDFALSRLTVRRVLDRMEREGLLYRVQGSGTFVSEPRVTKSVELTSFSEDMRARGLHPGSAHVVSERLPVGHELGIELGLSPQVAVWHLRRVRTADGQPMALEDLFIPLELLPSDFELDESQSLYSELAEHGKFRPDHAIQTIRAALLDADEAALLQVAPFTAALSVRRVVFDARNRAIERAHTLYRADRYSYELTIAREPGGVHDDR